MPEAAGSLQQLLGLLAKAFAPFEEALRDDPLALLAELGLDFPDQLADDPAFSAAAGSLAALLPTFPDLIETLASAVEAEDAAAIVAATVDLVDGIRRAVDGFESLTAAIDARKGSLPGLTPADVDAFTAGLPRRLVDYLVIRQAEIGVPGLAALLDLVGAFDRVEKNAGSANPLKPPYTERRIDTATALDFIESPGAVLESKYGWGAPGFDGGALFAKVERLAQELGLPAIFAPAPTPTLDLMFLRLQAAPALNPPGLELSLAEPIKAGTGLTLSGERWELVFGTSAEIEVGSTASISPAGDVSISPPAGQLSGSASVTFRTLPPAGGGPYLLIGEADASRLEIEEFSAKLEAPVSWNPSAGEARVDLDSLAAVKGGQLVIDLSSADGFIGELASAARIAASFDLAAGYSTADGFHFQGSGALEIQLPLHLDLGPIELDALTLSVGIEPKGLPIGVGADLKANLGPLQASVEDMGVNFVFSFPDDGHGNLGPLDLDVGFRPPKGVGLAIDAAVVKGGGYLYFDFDKEEYAGALELVFTEIVTVKAIGLITTRLPDGSEGFSLLVIISAEFGTPFQLGFGFTLNAVGGLLGLNRTMELEKIAQGVRTGAVESVMFPTDIIANAPRIISDLREFFPPAEDRFLIGPMAKLGWGTPSLVTVSLGVIVEVPPGNIAILGVLKVALPDERAALIIIQVNFIGALEVDKQRLWFFAGLFDSRVIFITLEGEMGLLMAWGTDANFVLSVGGFHPSFQPPPMPFPSPKRVSVPLLNQPLAKVMVSGYFAVTSNTAQFGASVDVYFGLSEFGISGHLGFDALFQFSPFYFIITISASLDVKVFGIGLFSVHFRGELEGTSPWHIEGEGSISLLFWDIDVPFSHTWGEDENTTLPPIDVLPLLTAELEKLDNWTAEVPAANTLLVSLRDVAAGEGLILHPVGVLKVAQRALPLDLDLDKVGNQTPRDVRRLTLAVDGGDLAKTRDTTEPFATAQFKNLGDGGKLSAPAYEPQHAGMELSVAGAQQRSGAALKRVVRYEEIIIDNNRKRRLRRFVGFTLELFAHFLKGNAASKSVLSAAYAAQKAPVAQKIAVADTVFVVASSVDNTLADEAARFTSHAQAQDYLRAQVGRSPELADTLHVIPESESRNAA